MRVLFATDFYLASVTARDLVAKLPWSRGLELELVHVLTPAPRVSWFARGSHSPEVLKGAAEALRSFGARLDTVAPDLRRTVLIGDPARRVVERAGDTQAELVVIGGPGRAEQASDGPSDFTRTVVTSAPCSVLVARTPGLDGLASGMSARAARAGILDAPVLRALRQSVAPPHMALTVVAMGGEASDAQDGMGARVLARTRGSLLFAREWSPVFRGTRRRRRATLRMGS